jgi:hypothetical protein
MIATRSRSTAHMYTVPGVLLLLEPELLLLLELLELLLDAAAAADPDGGATAAADADRPNKSIDDDAGVADISTCVCANERDE